MRDSFGKWEAKEGEINQILKKLSGLASTEFLLPLFCGKKGYLGIQTSIVLSPEMKTKAGGTIPRESSFLVRLRQGKNLIWGIYLSQFKQVSGNEYPWPTVLWQT